MAFYASNNRIYITDANGRIVFDTNSRAPVISGVNTLSNLTISFNTFTHQTNPAGIVPVWSIVATQNYTQATVVNAGPAWSNQTVAVFGWIQLTPVIRPKWEVPFPSGKIFLCGSIEGEDLMHPAEVAPGTLEGGYTLSTGGRVVALRSNRVLGLRVSNGQPQFVVRQSVVNNQILCFGVAPSPDLSKSLQSTYTISGKIYGVAP